MIRASGERKVGQGVLAGLADEPQLRELLAEPFELGWWLELDRGDSRTRARRPLQQRACKVASVAPISTTDFAPIASRHANSISPRLASEYPDRAGSVTSGTAVMSRVYGSPARCRTTPRPKNAGTIASMARFRNDRLR